MKALLVHMGLTNVISREGIKSMANKFKAREVILKAHSSILLSLGDEVLRQVINEDFAFKVWEILKRIFLKISFVNKLILKNQLYTLLMDESKDLRHRDEFNRIFLDLVLLCIQGMEG